MERLVEFRNESRYHCVSVWEEETCIKKRLINGVPELGRVSTGTVRLNVCDNREHCFLDVLVSVPRNGVGILVIADTEIEWIFVC